MQIKSEAAFPALLVKLETEKEVLIFMRMTQYCLTNANLEIKDMASRLESPARNHYNKHKGQ